MCKALLLYDVYDNIYFFNIILYLPTSPRAKWKLLIVRTIH